METEPQITFRGLDSSPALTELAHDHIAKLERSFDRITSCRVTIEKSSAQGQKGHLFKVSVDMEVPGGFIAVNRKPGDLNAHEDVKVAMRDAFAAARRQLDDHVQKMGGVHVKSHPESRYGRVARLFSEQGYGFIETGTGTDVYFGRESVTGPWDDIQIGSEVEFSLMEGDKGPFAVNVSHRG